jgi:hypothetical protein
VTRAPARRRRASDDSSRERLEAHGGERLFDAAAWRVEDPAEVAQVLERAQVVIEAGGLGHVADLSADRRSAGGRAEHAQVAGLDALDADDRA